MVGFGGSLLQPMLQPRVAAGTQPILQPTRFELVIN
jgi:hypothetical protein